jgi:hypothetical protein
MTSRQQFLGGAITAGIYKQRNGVGSPFVRSNNPQDRMSALGGGLKWSTQHLYLRHKRWSGGAMVEEMFENGRPRLWASKPEPNEI